MIKKINKNRSGFTIVELAAVIVIIAIITAISVVSYTALQQKAQDTAVQSDIDSVEGIVEDYGLKNKLENAYYYSGNPADVATLGFTPSGGNIIDVVTNHNDYCIRGYNKDGTKNSIYNAFTKESKPGICIELKPSNSAVTMYSGENIWTQVSSSYQHTCAIDAYGKAYCWGLNDYGQLGDGNVGTNSNSPVAVYTDSESPLAGKRIKYIETGYWHTCAIASDDNVYCWGRNTDGQLGTGDNNNSNLPVPVKTSGNLSGKTIKKLAVSWAKACVLASDNYEYCWGNGSNGSLGWSSWVSGNSNEPVPVYMGGVLSGKIVKDIVSPGSDHSCLIASDNKIYCWGYNGFGQLGDNTIVDKSTPVAVDTSGLLKGLRAISFTTNNNTTCIIASDNKAYCWGKNDLGQLGINDGAIEYRRVPVAVYSGGILSGKNLIGISSSYNDSICAYSTDIDFYCWGANYAYQLGDGTSTNSVMPVESNVMNSINTTVVSAGGYGSCVINSENSLYCWGDGSMGRIGAGNYSNSSTPVLVNHVN